VGKNTPVPDADTLSGFSKLAADTARSHLRAAESLLRGEFWGQARSIAVIAFEEAGKAWLSVMAMLSPDELKQQFPFGDLEWNHQWKLGAARSMRKLLAIVRSGDDLSPNAAEALADLDALAREDNAAKQRGLYTDYADGALRSPADITEEQARAMVAVVEDVLDNAGPLIDFATVLWARDNLPPAVLSFLQQPADAAHAGDDAMATFVQDELQNIEPLAGMLKNYPEWIRGILTVAQQLGEI
jgi:AbiV family abortive infection protein